MGLYQKLANVMANISGVKKAGKNAFFNYKFTTADDAYGAVRTALAEEGLAFIASMVDVQQHETGQADKSGNPVVRTVARFEYRFVDPETGECQTCLWYGEATDSQDKGVSKASTSALKYFLMKTFIISTEADDPDKSDGYDPKRKPAPSPAAIRDAGNKLDEQPERPAKPANVVPMPQPGEQATSAKIERPMNPQQVYDALQRKAIANDKPADKVVIAKNQVDILRIRMEEYMNEKVRKYIIRQTFKVDTSKELTFGEMKAIMSWLPPTDKVTEDVLEYIHQEINGIAIEAQTKTAIQAGTRAQAPAQEAK